MEALLLFGSSYNKRTWLAHMSSAFVTNDGTPTWSWCSRVRPPRVKNNSTAYAEFEATHEDRVDFPSQRCLKQLANPARFWALTRSHYEEIKTKFSFVAPSGACASAQPFFDVRGKAATSFFCGPAQWMRNACLIGLTDWLTVDFVSQLATLLNHH